MSNGIEAKPDCEKKLIMAAGIGEFFDGEQYDLVVSALQLYLRNTEQGTRAEELAKAMLANNPLIGEGKKLFPKLLNIFNSSPEINKSAESELLDLGFTMRRDKSGHNQLIYKNNPNYKFTATCSPSDRNAGTNRMQEMRRRISIYKD